MSCVPLLIAVLKIPNNAGEGQTTMKPWLNELKCMCTQSTIDLAQNSQMWIPTCGRYGNAVMYSWKSNRNNDSTVKTFGSYPCFLTGV